MTFGLAGAHRTGKTTLAREYAKKHGWKFAETSVSAIFKELGVDPQDKFDFTTRLSIQETILSRLQEFYRANAGNNVITDRTPIDMMAYTMAEAIGDQVSPTDQARFAKYVSDCFEATNRWFSCILVVQPGIPIIMQEGKAAPNPAYMSHLNALIIGLCCDERLKMPHYYIPKWRTELKDRIVSIDGARARNVESLMVERKNVEKIDLH